MLQHLPTPRVLSCNVQDPMHECMHRMIRCCEAGQQPSTYRERGRSSAVMSRCIVMLMNPHVTDRRPSAFSGIDEKRNPIQNGMQKTLAIFFGFRCHPELAFSISLIGLDDALSESAGTRQGSKESEVRNPRLPMVGCPLRRL